MTFTTRLDSIAKLVDERLDARLPQAGGRTGVPRRLAEAMRYAVLGGGKRIRPFLVVESARMLGAAAEAALEVAAAIECVHCYSLVHDDLPAMDDDALRRGRPTLHIAFDEATAILAGDALLTLAFEILSDPQVHADAAVRGELVLGLARAAGAAGMVGGQQLDLEAEGRRLAPEEIRRLQAMKTGALIAFSCEAGAILAAAAPGVRAALKGYGEALGQAFQLADDLLDAEGSSEEMGKATGKDAAAGKATLVAALGPAAARSALAELEREATARLASFGAEAGALIEAARFVTQRRR